MVVFKYGFVIQKTNQTSAAKLPDASGLLSKLISSSVIMAANTAVMEATIEKSTEAPDAKRGRYHHYSKKERAEIAIEFEITTTVCHSASLYPTRDEIPISTIAK